MFIIDTLEFSRDLQKVGMHQKIKDAQIQSAIELATKSDVATAIVTLKQEIKIAMLTTIVSLGTIVALVEKFFG